jgi:opacity protein-like surface antigen
LIAKRHYNSNVVNILVFAGVALISSQAFAQTDPSLATPTGHELNASVGGYTYTEPGAQSISIHGVKVGGEYTATLSLNKRRHWFAQADVRGTLGSVTYTGWCSPFLITPNSASQNGYELDFGDASPCSERGDRDWYLEARVLAGKDLIGRTWAWSPYGGLGVRHLSNGTTGTAGYRTDEYVYLPVGMTARTRVASHGALSVNLEFDRLLHGWQKTRGSELGGGDVPATTTAPAFTIDGFTDVSFSQPGGWALRAGAKYQITRHWSVEPFYLHWNVSASSPNDQTVTFTVNQVTARERIGFYEPLNTTDEFGVKWGFHF